MYKQFINWLEVGLASKQVSLPSCEECNGNCNVCLNSLVGLEELGVNCNSEFKARVSAYITAKINEGSLNPSNNVDRYLSVIYLLTL